MNSYFNLEVTYASTSSDNEWYHSLLDEVAVGKAASYLNSDVPAKWTVVEMERHEKHQSSK